MRSRARGKSPSSSILIVAAFTFAVCAFMWARPTFANDSSDPPLTSSIAPVGAIAKSPCPAGYKAEFRFGATSLFVDLAWVSLGTMAAVQKRFDGKCPDGPIQDIELVFNQTNLGGDTLEMFVRVGLPDYISIRSNVTGSQSRSLPTAPSNRRIYPAGAVEDVTAEMIVGKDDALEKRYRIEPTVGPNGSEQIYLIACGGSPSETAPGRRCKTVYRTDNDLKVDFSFRQDRYNRRGLAWPTPDGTITEPNGFLEMDSRVRQFVDQLRRNR